jgi:hypothetical protein
MPAADYQVQVIPTESLTTEGTQTRSQLDPDAVRDYKVLWEENYKHFPPCDVFFDGTDYWVGGGHHRITAARQAGKAEMQCRVRQGTKNDAILFGFKDNDKNGVRRTNADKRHSVQMILEDPLWGPELSDRSIGNMAGVSRTHVMDVRKSLEGGDANFAIAPKGEKVKGSDGKLYPSKRVVPAAAPALRAIEEEKATDPMDEDPWDDEEEEEDDDVEEADDSWLIGDLAVKAAPVVAAKPSKNGSMKFDFHRLELEIGAITRKFDDLNGVYRNPVLHQKAMLAVRSLLEIRDEWMKKVG